MNDTIALTISLMSLLVGLAIGKAWERYKLRDGRWIDRRKIQESPHYILGLNFLVSNQIDLAIEELTKAAGLDAPALEIHLILGNLYRERGQVSKAIQLHQSLLQRPNLSPMEQAYVLLCLGLDFKRGGFIDRSFQAFTEVTRLDPGNHYALLNLEKLHEEQQQWEEAHAIRQRLADSATDGDRPRDQSILAFLENELGLQASRENLPDLAIQHFERALELDNQTVPALLNLGDVYMSRNEPEKAITIWQQITETAQEKSYLAFDRLEKAYAQLNKPTAFVNLCQQLVDGTPQDWRARLSLGQHHANNDRAAQALEFFFESLIHNPHALAVHQSIWRSLATLEFNPALVRRYIELTHDAVFYLDPHICIRCRYRSTELLWQCPQCHEWNTFVEERISPAEDAAQDTDIKETTPQ